MTNILNYSELRKDGRFPLRFDRIYPKLSGTLTSQAYRMIPGLTLVTFFDDATTQRFNSILDRINIPNHKIHRTKRFHSTLLGLLSNTNPYFDELVKKEVNKFLNGRSLEYEIQFKLVRPGKWSEKDGVSDGTIIAYGEPGDSNNSEFIQTGDELAEQLKKKLPSIFDENFERKFPTIWSTLGYYKEDFELKHEPKLVQEFENLKSDKDVTVPIKVSRFELVESNSKDLEFSETIATI